MRGFVANLLAIVVAIASPPAAADAPAKSVAELAAQLDSPRYQERRRAQQELAARSLAELAPLRELARKSPSSEVRTRLESIFEAVEHRELAKAFEKLVAAKSDEEIDLDESLWLVTRIADPNPSREEMTKGLDDLAALVRRRLSADVPPAKQDPRRVMETIHATLYGEKKFRINFLDYDNLANASALEVLRHSRGLPITLGMVTIAVGRRLQLPIDGVATPGRYLVKYRANPKSPLSRDDIFLDPLGEGHVMTLDDVVPNFTDGARSDEENAKVFGSASHRTTVRRMLTNVAGNFVQMGDDRRLRRISQYLQIVGEDEMEATAESGRKK